MTDRELLLAYVEARDADSLGVLLRRYQDSLLRFVSRLLGDSHAAQDVVQETFLEAAKHPRRLLRVDSCHNWLLRVARNRSVDLLRKETRRRRHTEAAAALRSEEETEERASPAFAAERAESCQAMRIAIDHLPPRQKEVLLLRVEAGKSYREIAEITGFSPTNVGYILHRTMKDLSARLAPREGRNR